MLIDNFGRDRDHMLPFPETNQVEGLQRRDDVVGANGSACSEVFDRQVAALCTQCFEEHLGPIGPKGELAQIGKGLLGRPDLALAQRDVVGEVDQKFAIAFPLMLRQDQNAGDVIPFRRALLLREVARERLGARGILLAEHVEEKRVDVIVQRLVIEEELGEEAEALAVHLGCGAIHLVQGQARRLRETELRIGLGLILSSQRKGRYLL